MSIEPRTALFDFDGTIGDSEPVLVESINALAPEFGFEPLTKEEMPKLRVMSVRQFATKRLGIPLWNLFKLARLEMRGKEEFTARSANLQLFAGIPDLIRDLRVADWRIGVVSSSVKEVVDRVLHENHISVDFVYAGGRILGKAHEIKRALKEFNVNPERALYIGDELRDVKACAKVGIQMIAVSWGLNDGDTLAHAGVEVAHSPQDLKRKMIEHV
jgi:phosphoglycolate phosphatase